MTYGFAMNALTHCATLLGNTLEECSKNKLSFIVFLDRKYVTIYMEMSHSTARTNLRNESNTDV